MAPRLVLIAALVAGAGLVALAAVQLDERTGGDPPASLLYLPSGPYLRLSALGQEALAADLLFLWAIQYYSTYDESDRHQYLEAVFHQAITELDPHYVDAYWIGALVMSLEAKEPDAALALLDKGVSLNPQSWHLPYLAGWEAYFHGRYDRARGYFEAALAHPEAPPHLERVVVALLEKAGHAEDSLAEWIRLAGATEDEYVLSVAHRNIRRLHAQVLGERVGLYRERTGRFPGDLDELVRSGLVAALPRAPDGRPYAYDPATGTVSEPEARVVKESR